MSGLSKQLYRTQAKKAYAKFVVDWKKRGKDSGGKVVDAKGRELRRPTFKEWLQMAKAYEKNVRESALAQAVEAKEKLDQEFKDEKSLEWE
jgi:hypothetical protein